MLSLAAPSFAQTERGFIEGVGGFAVSAASTSPRVTSGNWTVGGGARIAPQLLVFGDVGRMNDLTPSTSQSAVADTVSTLSSTDAVNVVGTARMPARYAVGGLRWQPRTTQRVVPFILGGVGVAHLMPSAQFTFESGTLPNADPSVAVPNTGDDVTAELSSGGVFTAPAASNALMLTAGGGAQFDLVSHWTVEADYRLSRISTSTPLHAQAIGVGLGYRF